MNRRDFVALGATTALGWATGCTTRKAQPGEGIIDTHTHFYDPSRAQGVPWPPKDDPVLYRRFLPQEFVQLTRPLGVTGTVVVEASPWVEDNSWLLDLAAENPVILGVVGNLVPGTPDFPAHLRRFARNPRFRGIRIGLEPMKAALSGGTARRDLERLADSNLSLDLLIPPDHMIEATRLAQQIPSLRMVVDHCCNVPVGPLPPQAWIDGISASQETPNLFMKISGLVEGTGRRGGQAPQDPAFYQPTVRSILKSFGPDRVLFGSNWPVSLHFAQYCTVLDIVNQEFLSLGTSVHHRYFRENAIRFYGLSIGSQNGIG